MVLEVGKETKGKPVVDRGNGRAGDLYGGSRYLHIAGDLGASTDQGTRVLTSYLYAKLNREYKTSYART